MSTSVVQNFLKSAQKVLVVKSLPGALLDKSPHNVLILDSSFNPPHKGHLSIIEQTIRHITRKPLPPSQTTSVVLMLAVNNVDKVVPKPEPFHVRLGLINAMSQELYDTYKGQISVTVCLTKFAKFADKLNAFEQHVAEPHDTCNWLRFLKQNKSFVRYSFLVGFDTIVRIFNPKYYVPSTVEQSLAKFMSSCDLVCLARYDKDSSFVDQLKYPERIKSGELEGVPSQWASKVVVLDPLDGQDTKNSLFLSRISSSEIRTAVNAFHNGGTSVGEITEYLNRTVPAAVQEHILKDKLYTKL